MAYAGAGPAQTRREAQTGGLLAPGFSGSFVINPIAGSERCVMRVFARVQMPAATGGPRFYLPGQSGGTYVSGLSGAAPVGTWRWGAGESFPGTFSTPGYSDVWTTQFLAFGPSSEMPLTLGYTMLNNGLPGAPAVACDAIISVHVWGFFEPGPTVLSVLQQTSFADNATGKFISSGLPYRHEAFIIHRWFGTNPATPSLPYNGPTDMGAAPTSVTPNGFTLRTTSSIFPKHAFWSRSDIVQPGNIRVPWPVAVDPATGVTQAFWGTNFSTGQVGISGSSFYEDPVLLAAAFGVYRDGRVHAT